MAQIYRPAIFLFISFLLHFLFLQIEISRHVVSQAIEQHGVGYVSRSAQQFLSVQSSSVFTAETVTQKKVETPQPPMPRLDPSVRQQSSKNKKLSSLATPLVAKPQKSVEVLAVRPSFVSEFTETTNEPVALMNKPKERLASPKVKETVRQTVAIATSAQEGHLSTGHQVASLFPAQQKVRGPEALQQAMPRYDINPLPQYPKIARRRGQQGTVQLEVLVQADGRVGEMKLVVSSGYKSLDRAAQKAVRHWQFKAAKSFGTPVVSRVVVPVDFVLGGN